MPAGDNKHAFLVCKSSPPEAMCTSVCCLVRVAHISVADREVSASDSLRTALDDDSCHLKEIVSIQTYTNNYTHDHLALIAL